MSVIAENLEKEILAIDVFQVLTSYYNILVFFSQMFHPADLLVSLLFYYSRMAPDLELNLGGDFPFLQVLYSALELAKSK